MGASSDVHSFSDGVWRSSKNQYIVVSTLLLLLLLVYVCVVQSLDSFAKDFLLVPQILT